MMKPQKTMQELIKENRMLRREIKVAREAADITTRLVVKQFEKTEQSLHRTAAANSQRQAILEAATQLSIIATDLSGNITLFNRGAENLLGYAPGEMMDQPVDRLHLLSELQQYARKLSMEATETPAAVTVFDQHVKQQIVHASEWTYLCKNGTHLPVNLSVTAFYNARGTMKGYLFTAMDMSSQKQMQQDLIQAMETAETANASKGDFLARMSHEIRTPMNGIIGMAYLMEKTSLTRTQKNYLDKILSSAKTLLSLINDILDFSKIDAGKLTLEYIEFQLEDVLVDLYNTIGFQAEEKGLEFLFHMDDSLPPVLKGDPLRLGQILINLAGNAIKFTQAGEIIISVTGEKIRTGPDPAFNDMTPKTAPLAPDSPAGLPRVMLTFSVKDSGIGLAPDQLDHLFEAFSQADGSITRKYGGTGLGLSICSQLVQMMGGQIQVDSTPKKGTTFTFTVMLQYTIGRHLPGRLTKTRFQGLRALVVDDNQAARQLLASMLTSFHMQVDTASDGKTALASLKTAGQENRPYDVILLDWIMPQMDGIETARRIHRDKALAKIPAMLMVTASSREQARQKGEKSGINAFLTKPVYPSVMFDTLIRVMDIRDRSDDLSGPAQPVTRPSPGQMTGARILLAEDNPINQEVAAGLLMDMGIDVHIAGNGRICLEKLEKNAYDLILMDIQMPEMDGLETTRRIRQDPRFSDLPVIAMTAHAMAGDREKSLEAGMNDHITKPVEPAALCDILQRFLPGDRQPAPAAGDPAAGPKKTITWTSSGSGGTASGDPEATLPAALPDMAGIDPDQALNHVTPAMLIKLLHDFKKSYQDLPEKITACQADADLETIRITAHTIKGVAGYIGALPLQQAAGELETFLKQARDGSKAPDSTLPASDRIIQGFITEIRTVLNSLDQLPPVSTPGRQPVSGDRDPRGDTGTDSPLPLTEKEKKVMQHFSDLLINGELTAEELLPDVRTILTRCGFQAELAQIRKLMDDIEYDAAAQIINSLLR